MLEIDMELGEFSLGQCLEIHCFGFAQKAHNTAALLKLSRPALVTHVDGTPLENPTYATLSSMMEEWKIQP